MTRHSTLPNTRLRAVPRLPGAAAALALGLTLGLTLGLAPTASAAPADRPTEQSERVRVVQQGDQRVDVRGNRRCTVTEVGDGSLDVGCRRRGSIWLDYEFTVPRRAINVRGTLRRTLADDSRGSYARLDTYRVDRNTFQVLVNVAQGTRVRIHGVRLRYDLPTAYDDRPCVTRGEWAAVNVFRGGTGGTKRQVAAVFDTRGVREEISRWQGGFRYQVRAYPRCGSDRKIRLSFHKNRGERGWHSYWG